MMQHSLHHAIHHSLLHAPLVFLILGLLLLLLGRSLFWLFVGIAGFVAGVHLAPYLLPHQKELFMLIAAIVLGILGALLAIFLQKLAILVGGFLAGGYVATVLSAPLLGGVGIRYPGGWLCFLIGGILGAILLYFFFNWALIILSSIHGAHMVIESLEPPRRYGTLLVLIVALAGVLIQAATYRGGGGAVKRP